jgi:hypothetical protein
MTVKELGQRMDAEELIEWMVFDRFYPLPDAWMQTGITCQTIAQAWLKKKNGMPWSPQDFMPIARVRREVQSEAETMARIDAILGSVGG